MANRFRTALTALFMVMTLAGPPLHAQLDPRLQDSKTDFLNLYQQSTNTKVKPEVLTIFDFSGSMEALMFHPLFVNTDTEDTSGVSMKFVLTPAVPGTPANNTYTVRATSIQNPSAYVQWSVTVGGTAGPGVSSGTFSQSRTSGGRTYTLRTTVTATTTPSGTISGTATYTFAANIAMTCVRGTGASNISNYSTSVNGGLTWTVSGGSNSPITTNATVNTGSSSWNSTQSNAWTAPAYDGTTTGGTDAYVTATLPVAVGNKSSLTSRILVKPDGSQVTAADADAASDSTQYGQGASQGAADVRNWVRAASHARFQATVDSSVVRTIDIPIPWKITDASSTGNPLSSVTLFDRQTKTDTNGTVTIYGSGTNIEMDKNWSITGGSRVLSGTNASNAGSTSTQTTTTLSTVTYRADYIAWLFTGKYTVGSYSTLQSRYIVYDALNHALVPAQGADSWGQGYGAAAAGGEIMVPVLNINGTYTGTEIKSKATVNVVPGLSRAQAVKRAAISAWINHQADVLWAYRFLDVGSEAGNGSATNINNNSATTFNVTAGAVTTYQTGKDSAWTVLNNTASQGITSMSGNSVVGMGRIASLFAGGSTPLTYAMARGLAQFTDPKSVFNAVETGADAPSQCMNHFLILFTDGFDNNGTNNLNDNAACPYLITSGSTTKIDALLGNQAIIATKGSGYPGVNRYGDWWNLFTFAGIAAHLGDSSLGNPGTDYLPAIDPGTTAGSGATPSTFLPFSLYKRNTTLFTKPHLVTTMTVGVSLGGTLAEGGGPKRSLFSAAAVGDPSLSTWSDTSTLKPFEWSESANSGNGGRVSGSIYYFDATDPDKLSSSLDHAIISAIGASNINTASNPNTPFIGAALSGEMFIGKFQPPTNGGSIWTGDLLMFGTRLVNDQLQILDSAGAVTTKVDSSTAQWSALNALTSNRLWNARNLYTRIPATSANPTPGLSAFTYTGTAYTDTLVGLQNFVCRAANNPNIASYGAGSAAQKRVLQWAMGGDITKVDSAGVPTSNRPNIMGDIINSSPIAIEYKFSDVSGGFTGALAGVGGSRFRLILVGTNQGFLHAFGEVVKQENADATNTSTPVITKGAVDELWSFMPTDFLGYLDQLTVTNNPHRFMVDGAPAIYHLDLPPTTGGPADALVEASSAPGPERAIVIFGLGKGGRSYYALDIHDPYHPSLRWSLIPDEANLLNASGASVLAARILPRPGAPTAETVRKVVTNMGFSTCTPGIGRIQLTDSSGNAIIRDAVFLGGGLSVPEIEANFPDAASKPTPMGRSVLALDAYTGQILAAVDLSAITTSDSSGKILPPGPVSRGVVPFEFFLNSGMAQRAYFLDHWGGLWSWGCQKTDTNSVIPTTTNPNPTYQYRSDSSDLAAWTVDGSATSDPGIRLVAKDLSGTLVTLSGYATTQQYYSEALYSTLPAPFRVGTFTGKSKNATGPVPAAVGIAIESGDKNNPLDFSYTASIPKPTRHRLSVVFDRQDSLAWGSIANPVRISATSTAVMDAFPLSASLLPTSPEITPGNASYYLAPANASATKFGYFVNFPSVDSHTGLVPKGINSPLVVSGSLFYSYFKPTEADPCTGGTGLTYTNLICDAINPIVVDTRTNMACQSGEKASYTGVASDLIALGTRGAIQIGTKDVPNPKAGESKTTLTTKTIAGKVSNQYPKARVWRTVH